ncbi:uncharacterized protein L203_104912 [Cryptococcus depauperatus CBS 7841]|uniref:Uncharacterized protein n=1 Tax=Cryptococcus depauperatus CBS 7841 TaxID=1295531 RepID=A0AAJ8JWG6_9TREE
MERSPNQPSQSQASDTRGGQPSETTTRDDAASVADRSTVGGASQCRKPKYDPPLPPGLNRYGSVNTGGSLYDEQLDVVASIIADSMAGYKSPGEFDGSPSGVPSTTPAIPQRCNLSMMGDWMSTTSPDGRSVV